MTPSHTFSRRCRFFGGALAFFVSSSLLTADVKLPALFTDHMVLQRNKPVAVWGWADEGEEVSVTFRGVTKKTVAKDGKWKLHLPQQKAGGPEVLSVKGKNALEIKDVLIGEVWVCSGQSNMEWPLSASFQPEGDISSANNPNLRLFTVPKNKQTSPVNDVKSSWRVTSPESAKAFSAVAYYFGRDLQKALGVPVGLIHTSWGGSPAEVWMSSDALEQHPTYQAKIVDQNKSSWSNYENGLKAWQAENDKLKAEGKPNPKRAPGAPWRVMELYNGMIHPLINYGIAGAIWYQGESNAGRAELYRSLFPDMIKNWRAKFQQGDFPFLAVQLAPWDHNKKRTLEQITEKIEPSEWAELREAQSHAAKTLPRVGVAVITDVGDKDDIHPAKKQPVGERLALLARDIAYGEKVLSQGPVFVKATSKENKLVLTFDKVGKGLVARDGDLKGFSIAGEDKVFHWAQATITSRNTIEVWSPSVAKPVAARFGWSNYPVVNLWNNAGLPASPFRTDNWPLITAGR